MSNPAETYENYMVPPLFAPAAQRLVDTAGPQAGARVLDVACGTGVVARQVAQRIGTDGQVVGLDLSPDMLAVAREMAGRERLAIDWREGRAEALPFPDGSFTLALCQFGLMFFADRSLAVAEMHRILTDNGRVAASVWQGLERHSFYRTLHDVIEQRFGESSIGDIFALGDADELLSLFARAGFRDVEVESFSLTARFPDPAGFLAGEIDVDTAAIPAMQRLTASERQAITAAIRDEMAEPLRTITEGDHVAIPFHAYVVQGRR